MLLFVLVALLPFFAGAYIYVFQNPSLLFMDHEFHEIAIGVATLQGSFISYVAWRCYMASGEQVLRWLTLSFIGFTLVYGLHGIFTPLSNLHMALFLLYGPAARVVMACCLLAGLLTYGKPPHQLSERNQKTFWFGWIVCFLLLDIIVAWVALSVPAYLQAIRITMESGALMLILAGAAYILLRKIQSWMMVVFMFALVYLAQSSLIFLVAKPWNHLWWLAHIASAAGFTILSYGVIKAFRTTRSLSSVFNQEEIFEQLVVAEAKAIESAHKFKSILDNLYSYVALLDINGIIQEVNQALLDRSGYSREDVVGQYFYDTPFWNYDDQVREQLLVAINAAKQGMSSRYDVVVKMGDELVPIDFLIAPVRDDSGEIVGLLPTAVDITDRKHLEEELQSQAHLDYLTGLPNRRSFMGRGEVELSRAQRYDNPLSILMLDIDHFKKINDAYGHQAGDIVLKSLAMTFQEVLRNVDIIGRLGGEEFAAILSETRIEIATEVAERLREVISAGEVRLSDGTKINYTVSIGIASIIDKVSNIHILLNEADRALYRAKQAGRNKVCI